MLGIYYLAKEFQSVDNKEKPSRFVFLKDFQDAAKETLASTNHMLKITLTLCNYVITIRQGKTVRDCKEVILLYCLKSFLKFLMIYIITAQMRGFLLYSSPRDKENAAGWGT